MISYPCPHCHATIQVADTKAGRAHVCDLCSQSSLVPADHLWLRRLEELQRVQAKRHLTAAELTEGAELLRRLGRDKEAQQAESAAARQSERERQAAGLAAAGVPVSGPAATPAPPHVADPPPITVQPYDILPPPVAAAQPCVANWQPPAPPPAQPFPWDALLLGILLAGPAFILGLVYVCLNDPQKKRSGTVLMVTGASVMALGAFVGMLLGVAGALDAQTTGPSVGVPAPAAAATAQYRVTGSGFAMVTYMTAGGGMEQHTVPLPWTSEGFAAQPGTSFSLTAQAQSAAAQISVEILIDGGVWKSASSSGDYCMASASGLYGME